LVAVDVAVRDAEILRRRRLGVRLGGSLGRRLGRRLRRRLLRRLFWRRLRGNTDGEHGAEQRRGGERQISFHRASRRLERRLILVRPCRGVKPPTESARFVRAMTIPCVRGDTRPSGAVDLRGAALAGEAVWIANGSRRRTEWASASGCSTPCGS